MPKEKYQVMRDRGFMLTPVYWNAQSHTSKDVEKIYKIKINQEYQMFYPGRMKVFYLKKEWIEKEKFISNKLINQKYFKNIKINIEAEAEKIEKFISNYKNIDISKYSFDQLIKLAVHIKKLWMGYDVANVLSWYVGGDMFIEFARNRLNLTDKKFLLLTTPKEMTYVSQLEFEILKYTKLIKERKINLEKAAQKLSDNYGWIPFGYDGLDYWDKKYFIRLLKIKIKNYSKKIDLQIRKIKEKGKDEKKQRQILIKIHKLGKKEIDLIERVRELTFWTDHRKKMHFRLHRLYSNVLLELGQRYDIPYKNLKYLFTEELYKLDKDSRELKIITGKRIKNKFIMEYKNGKDRIVTEKEKNKILKDLDKQIKQSDIRGITASRGKDNKYIGRVKIMLNSKDGEKVKKGDFIVATMTTPDYIISMKKAAGFITDEGGITCHAAIVSREMEKPCIIGTKIATQVLKDGDVVEVDIVKAKVKILK